MAHLIRLVLALYNLAWFIALPFLKRSPRISLGWPQRTMKDAEAASYDLWIQAASGGESLLTNMVLTELNHLRHPDKPIKILATSGTQQGIDSLLKGKNELEQNLNFNVSVAYFPFDAPMYMRRAFSRFSPKLAVVVETELWPGFLYYARKKGTPVLLINGRMSEKSFGTYNFFHRFFSKYGPEKLWAISELDGNRFSRVVGPNKVERMNNIKFDRVKSEQKSLEGSPVSAILTDNAPFVLLGSIRREEEEKIGFTISRLLAKRPDIVIGLFPKHIERAEVWIKKLEALDIRAYKRSATTRQHSPGCVIVWDVFGELAGAYALAKTTFVGGSLVNLGGQNFLEPLVFGLKPIIGPHWKNFAWVSREIITTGLVHEVHDENELTEKLLAELLVDETRDKVIEQVQSYFSSRKGGTKFISQQILKYLS